MEEGMKTENKGWERKGNKGREPFLGIFFPNPTNGSYHSAEFIFPDFPGQNESFSPTNLFMRNTNVGFQSH